MASQTVPSAAERIVARADDLERTSPDFDSRVFVAQPIDLDDFSAFFGFGDSVGDSGNIGAALDFIGGRFEDPTPSALGYFENRFSNGPNYFDQLYAAITGDEIDDIPLSFDLATDIFSRPDLGQGVNFAVGGATAIPALAIDLPDLVEDFGISFTAQVDLLDSFLRGGFFAGSLSVLDDVFGIEVDLPEIPDGALFATNFGGNDLFEFRDANPDLADAASAAAAFTERFVAAYEENLVDLIDAGARDFLIAGAPNVGVVPDVVNAVFPTLDAPANVQASAALFQPLIDDVNAALLEMLTDLVFAYPETRIYFFDSNIAPLAEDPAAFGLDPALTSTSFVDAFEAPGSTVTLDDLPLYAFIDDVHPTAVGQDFVFDQALRATQVGTSVDAAARGGPEAETLRGGATDDAIEGGGGADRVFGGAGADLLFGGAGKDRLVGGRDGDLLVGGGGGDVLKGGGGGDAISGGGGRDDVRGGAGDDTLNGGAGDDRLFGRAGDDIIDGDAGDDRLVGDGGSDVFVFTGEGGPQRDKIVDFETGRDVIDVSRFDGDGIDASEFDALLDRSSETDRGAVLALSETDSVALRNIGLDAIEADWFVFAG